MVVIEFISKTDVSKRGARVTSCETSRYPICYQCFTVY